MRHLSLLFIFIISCLTLCQAEETDDLFSANHAEKEDSLFQDTKEINLHEVQVNESRHQPINATFTGKDMLTEKDIQNIPTLMGEADVMRAIRQLPGVQSVSEGNSGIYVRGGSAGQNLFILDDMELLNPSHLMGLFSVFNPLITSRVDVYKGNVPANLQGRLSSTIDVQTKEPQEANPGFEINVGNISSTIAFLKKSRDGRFDITMGYRRSYLGVTGWCVSPFIPEKSNYFLNNDYQFYDFNGKIQARLSNKTKLMLAWYDGKDDFNFSNTDMQYVAATNWGNRSAILQLTMLPDPSNSINTAITYNSTYSGFNGDILSNNLVYNSFFEQIQWKNKWEHRWGNHLTHTGVILSGQHSIPVNLALSYLTDTLTSYHVFRNILGSVYAGDYYYAPSGKLTIYAGIRVTTDAAIGPYTYGDKNYTENQIVKTWFTFSPVVSLSLFPKQGHSVKMAASINDQQLHLAALSSIPLPNDIWVSSTPRLRPETSDQLTIGYYRTQGYAEFSVEAYGKYMKNQLIFNVITDENIDQSFEDQFFHGKGVAFGVDVSISKKTGFFTGMLTYSYSRSLRSFPLIMDGGWFNDKNDRPHDFNLSLAYTLNKTWDFSAGWVFASGNNMTLPSGRWWMMGQIMNDYDDFNGFRFPPYHRLDISASWHLKPRRLKESVINFSIINVYNRANPYYAYFKVYMGENQYNLDIRSYQVSLFPILPSVSWRFKF